MEPKNGSGDPVSVCGYAYRGGGGVPAERVGPCAVCGTMTFASFSLPNTAIELVSKFAVPAPRRSMGEVSKTTQRVVVLCAHCANDRGAYAKAEARFGALAHP